MGVGLAPSRPMRAGCIWTTTALSTWTLNKGPYLDYVYELFRYFVPLPVHIQFTQPINTVHLQNVTIYQTPFPLSVYVILVLPPLGPYPCSKRSNFIRQTFKKYE